VRRLRHFAIADHDLRRAPHDRRDELRDVGAGVLIVGVGVDDDVGAEAERGVDAGDERGGESAVRFSCTTWFAPLCARRRRSCRRAVVDDERFDRR
jgi:hypothetical protein